MFEDDNLNNLTLNDDYIIGCDEVGTGTAAGPLVVCGVRAEKDLKFEKVRDCKIISMVKADTKIPSVMAASILAKTYRDEIMKNHHLSYDKYGWNTNVGYLTAEHIEAISKFGYTPLHRRSFNIKK